jgi:polar amino acid transport system substrate-binding protein
MRMTCKIFYLALLLFFSSSYLYAAEVKNVVAKQVGNRVQFTYDLVGDEADAEVDVTLTTIQGKSYKASDLHLEGAFGKVRTGKSKVIWWNVLQDFPRGLDANMAWRIEAGGKDFTSPTLGAKEWNFLNKEELATTYPSDILKKGVLVCGVKDSTPGFGYLDETMRDIVGYDVDFCRAIAKKLGVKLDLKPVTSATRIPQLIAGNIDLIAATMAKNTSRAKQIDFSYTYFTTLQKFITKKGTVKKLADLEGKKIGTAKGSTSEQNAKKALPTATIQSFDDYAPAFLALQQGKVFAITTDESILANILNKAPDKTKYEIPNIIIGYEPYGLGMRKGDTNFVNFVNATLLEMEKKGDARKIFNKWFGPKGKAFPMNRGDFKIDGKKESWEK